VGTDTKNAQKAMEVEVKKGEQLLTKLQEITAKQKDPDLIQAFTKTTNSLQE